MTDNAIITYDETEKVAKAMVTSGFFKDITQTSQAIVKILAGRELGFGPFASLSGVNVIQNKPVIGANLLASAIKATKKYNYRIIEMTDKACEIEFHEDGKPVGKSRFTWEDADKAGLINKDNWRKYPRNMLFARAISNGQKWYCPDACNGVTVYTPDEMDATVDENGQVTNMPETTEKEISPIHQSTIDAVVKTQSELVQTSGSLNEYPAWPPELITHLTTSNLGVKDYAKCVDMLNRSKIAILTSQQKHLEMWVNWYCQARKGGMDENASANDADHKLANIIAVIGK